MYFIANFQHLTDQQAAGESNRRYGAFTMMVEADSTETALGKFRQKLIDFRANSSLFEGRCSIYLSQLIEFDLFPNDEPVLVNFKSFAGDPVLPYISCVVPTEQSNACNIHEWDNNQPYTEGHKDSLFLDFE